MLELRTLGGLELLQESKGKVRAIPLQAKRLALLAYLAATPRDGFRRRDAVLSLFWPELNQERARGALRQALHFIRKSVGDGAVTSRGEDEIGLDRSLITSDATRLEEALRAGDLERALAIYRGDFLDGVFVTEAAPELEDWIATERTRLRGLAAKAAWGAAERPSSDRDTGEIVRKAVFLSGADEAALRRGITRLERRGDRVGAAALYEEFSRRFARDFEIELSPETKAAMQAVRDRQEAAPATPSPAPRASGVPSVDSTPSSTPRPRARRLLLAGAGGALLVLAMAAYFGASPPAAAHPSANRTAVLPFRVAEGDTALAWLHDGIVELLTTRLGGPGGMALSDPASVLGAWQRARSRDGPGALRDVARKVAAGVGATRVVEGSIAGGPARLTLTARLSAADGSKVFGLATAEGPLDSLPVLADRLAAQLLVQGAGLSGAQFAALAQVPPPALRAFLAGRAEYRHGRAEQAAQWFVEATALDSTFALAGFFLARAAGEAGRWPDVARGYAIATANRNLLGAADRAFLDADLADRNRVGDPIARWNAVVAAFPERPEAWYGLGRARYWWGPLAGEVRPVERAAEAFRRGWMLDSAAGAREAAGPPVAELTSYMMNVAHELGDTAEVVRLASTVLAHDTSTILARAIMWHQAHVTSDAARLAFWKTSGDLPHRAVMWMLVFASWSGLGTEDLSRLTELDQKHLRAYDPGVATFAFTSMALNGGRPSEVPQGGSGERFAGHAGLRAGVRYALWWDADTLKAIEAASRMAGQVAVPAAAGATAREQLYDACTLGEWRASRGDYAAAATASRRLRSARLAAMPDSAGVMRYANLCATLLDAMHADGLGQSDAVARIAVADSLARASYYAICCGDAVSDANLQLARLWERQGDLLRALAAVRRRAGANGEAPLYLSTFFREEGRLAALVGDTTAAIRAYRHYLALRYNPEPALQPAVDSVRKALAALEQAP